MIRRRHNQACTLTHTHLTLHACYRWKYRAAFVIWARENRWPIFCHQGADASFAKLNQLIATYKARQTISPASLVARVSDDAVASGSGPSKQELPPAALQENIGRLICAMYYAFGPKNDYYCRSLLGEFQVSGHADFGDVARAFGLPWIAENIIKSRFEVSNVACANAAAYRQSSHAKCCNLPSTTKQNMLLCMVAPQT